MQKKQIAAILVALFAIFQTALAQTVPQFLPQKQTNLEDIFWNKRLDAIRHVTWPTLLAHLRTKPDNVQTCRALETASNLAVSQVTDSVLMAQADSLATLLADTLNKSQPDFSHLKTPDDAQLWMSLKSAAKAYREATNKQTLAEWEQATNRSPQTWELPLQKYDTQAETFALLCAYTEFLNQRGIDKADSLVALVRGWYGNRIRLTGHLVSSDETESSTLAALRFAQWNLHLWQMTRNAHYFDIFERLLYNDVLSGFGVSGNSFNKTLLREGKPLPERFAWVSAGHLSTELTCFLSGVPRYTTATRGRNVYIDMYTRGTINVRTDSLHFSLVEKCSYPWAADAAFAVLCDSTQPCTLYFRVPEWLTNNGEVFEGSSFRYISGESKCQLLINEETITPKIIDGYAVISRQLHNDDFIGIRLPSKTRRISDEKKRITFQRGPFVFALEDADQPEKQLSGRYFDPTTLTHTEFRNGFLDNVQVFTGTVRQKQNGVESNFLAIPYYSVGTRTSGGRMKLLLEDKEYEGK